MLVICVSDIVRGVLITMLGRVLLTRLQVVAGTLLRLWDLEFCGICQSSCKICSNSRFKLNIRY